MAHFYKNISLILWQQENFSKNWPIPTSFVYFCLYRMTCFKFKLIKALMVWFGLEPTAAEWKAQMNPLSYGGTPRQQEHLRQQNVLKHWALRQVSSSLESPLITSSLSWRPSQPTRKASSRWLCTCSFEKMVIRFCFDFSSCIVHVWFCQWW